MRRRGVEMWKGGPQMKWILQYVRVLSVVSTLGLGSSCLGTSWRTIYIRGRMFNEIERNGQRSRHLVPNSVRYFRGWSIFFTRS